MPDAVDLRAQLTALRLSGAPMAARAAILAELDALGGDPVRRAPVYVRKCCDAAVVAYNCTCSYVVRCADHGDEHCGTHD